MVTVNKKIAANTGTATFELLGLSTDQKPTGTFSGYRVSDNSVYMELDTGDIYYFDEGEWQKMGTSGQGGGSNNDFVVTVDMDANMTITADKKIVADILPAIEAGKNVKMIAPAASFGNDFDLIFRISAHGTGGASGDGMVALYCVIPDTAENKSEIYTVKGVADINDGVETDMWIPVFPV